MRFLKQNQFQRGFTILEVTLVLLVLAFLVGAFAVAINPGRRLADARNSQRAANINSLLFAVNQRILEKSEFCPGQGDIPLDFTAISDSGYDICDCLVPAYFQQLPFDPQTGKYSSCQEDYDTGYEIMRDPLSGEIILQAPDAELGQEIKTGTALASESDDFTDTDFADGSFSNTVKVSGNVTLLSQSSANFQACSPAANGDYTGRDLTPANGSALSGDYCNVRTFTISAGNTVYAGSVLRIFAENAVIAGVLDGNGKGYAGGAGAIGGGNTGGQRGTGDGGGQAGGGGFHIASGGAGAGYGGAGGGGTIPDTSGSRSMDYSQGGVIYPAGYNDNPSVFGSGGGGGGTYSGGSRGGAGGAGGGAVFFRVINAITLNGSVKVNGLNGQNSVSGTAGGGGGGSGGSLWLDVGIFAGSGVISANGGAGGIAFASCGGPGGGGGGGRVAIHYSANSFAGAVSASAGSGNSVPVNPNTGQPATCYGTITSPSQSGNAGTTALLQNPFALSGGSFTSQIFSASPVKKITPQKIYFTADIPSSDTSLGFQIASADTENEITANPQFLGPLGTTNSTDLYTSSGQDISRDHKDKNYIRYKAFFKTSNADLTPILQQVNIEYVSSPGL